MFLQVNPGVAEKRGEFGLERYETSFFQSTVHQRFEELMEDKSVNWSVSFFLLPYSSGNLMTLTLYK